MLNLPPVRSMQARGRQFAHSTPCVVHAGTASHELQRDFGIHCLLNPVLLQFTRARAIRAAIGAKKKKSSCPLHRRICLLHRPKSLCNGQFRCMQQTDTSMQRTAAVFVFFFSLVLRAVDLFAGPRVQVIPLNLSWRPIARDSTSAQLPSSIQGVIRGFALRGPGIRAQGVDVTPFRAACRVEAGLGS